jgi:NhaA family Na+:H+ antiporter
MALKKLGLSFKAFAHWYKSAAEKGVALFILAMIAIAMANSSLQDVYSSFVNYNYHFYGFTFELSFVVNDILMSVFFFIIGMEIKRELISGHLATKADRILPIAAACGGVVMPVLIYLVLNHNDSTALKGWAVPAATDIAFALGVLALCGRGLPTSLRIFLTAVAIIDDLIAVIIIAAFYSSGLSSYYIGMILVMVLLTVSLNLLKSTSLFSYSIMGCAIWYAFYKSGLHPTLAGVVFGMLIPTSIIAKRNLAKEFDDMLSPTVSYFILPLFAFLNSGVTSSVDLRSVFSENIVLGVALGLFIGKQLGIFATTIILKNMKIVRLPQGATMWQFYCVSIVCGIGFTMSLFITNIAYPNDEMTANLLKIGVIIGSSLSALLGGFLLYLASPKNR